MTLNVGITGHRAHVLSDAIVAKLETRIDRCFERLMAAAQAIGSDPHSAFSDAPPLLRLHTALATGADQLAATAAKKRDYQVRALLPFPVDEYRRDFSDSSEHREFCEHLEAADSYFALPGTREAENHAYVMVGKAVIAAADVLIAVWDGKEGNGPGGTAHVVDLALRGGVPVLHVPVDRENETLGKTRLLTGGDIVDPEIAPLETDDDLEAIVREVLTPAVEMGLGDLETFFGEEEVTFNPRIEYPLLLAILGVKKLPSTPWHQMPLADALESYKAKFGSGYERQALAYEWSNFLAIRYAQLFRGGHITNYMLAALAVLTALAGLLLPDIKAWLVVGELTLIGMLLFNTKVGSEGGWHRKWLQYRHLAECLRPLPYLKRTGLVGPPFRNEHVSASRGRGAVGDWTRWYSAAIWREMPSPGGTMDAQAIRELAEEVVQNDVEDQVAYHRVNAKRMHELDHRLHLAGEVVMASVIAACGLYLVLNLAAPHLLKELKYGFVFVTAGFPALGAAVFGMRGHGEHLLAASRSANTANSLATNAQKLAQVRDIESLASELERTAEIMLSDLNEWTVAYSERSLQVPA
ncbi:MAG TPA: hypothetical protein VK839_06925 [Erythrobacter sp.]|nr:hypothetical protein [Erythrobacter sp.]